MLPINFNFKLASSVENLGGVVRYLLQQSEKPNQTLCVPRIFEFVGTKF